MDDRVFQIPVQRSISIPVKIKRLRPEAIIPKKEFPDSGGYDLYLSQDAYVPARSGSTIPLGFAVELPIGVGMFPFSRSGICIKGVEGWSSREAWEHGISSWRYDCKIRLGLVDADYRGECALLIDNDDEEFFIPAGMSIGQCVFLPLLYAEFEETDCLSPSLRGQQGFNS